MSKSKPVPPVFDTEAKEQAFWEIHDSNDEDFYIPVTGFRHSLPE